MRKQRRPSSGPGPAWLDLLQSATGLALGLFMIWHIGLEVAILIGRDAMYHVARALEGEYLFGRPLPWLVSLFGLAVLATIVVHAALALRKFPRSLREYRAVRAAAGEQRHADTRLWLWQVYTGFALFFLAPVHLFEVITNPADVGPYESADRIWTESFWVLYLLLLPAFVLHGGLGLYRLAMKWGWTGGLAPRAARGVARRVAEVLVTALLVIGLAALVAYVRIGIEHAPRAGERYVPAAGAAP